MKDNTNICPHGLLYSECNACRMATKVKPKIRLVEDKRSYEFEPPHPELFNFDINSVPTSIIKPLSSLEDRVDPITRPSITSSGMHSNQKSLIEQRKELLRKKVPSMKDYEPTDITEIADLEKKFLKKKK
ncbi:MAG: hypothetical protein GF364_18825 [Candidatus Lokiarchaeota archaeon]|nr:hypothetical protein [Candidatus Lokiarchaeota archaeon]